MIDVVCGVIQNEKGDYLACQRPKGKHLGGLWEFPGGKVEAGELPKIALARELLEELALEVVVGIALTPVIWDYGERTIRLRPFRCEVLRGEPQALEHQALRWCGPEDFHLLPWADADTPILLEIFPTR